MELNLSVNWNFLVSIGTFNSFDLELGGLGTLITNSLKEFMTKVKTSLENLWLKYQNKRVIKHNSKRKIKFFKKRKIKMEEKLII